MTSTAAVIRVGGVCALMGVAAALSGAVVGAIHGLGGQEIPLHASADFLFLVQNRQQYLLREWLFLAYAVFAVGEGIGLYFLTRPAQNAALWGLVAFLSGIVIGIVQDAAVVALVQSVAAEYAAANVETRPAIEALGRTASAITSLQQAIANLLLGLGVALYSIAVLRSRTASRWLGRFGVLAATASILYAVVTAAAPRFDAVQPLAEHVFGFVVIWDFWAGLVMARFEGHAGESA